MKSLKPFGKEVLSLLILGGLATGTYLAVHFWDRMTNYLGSHPFVWWLIGGYLVMFVGLLFLNVKYPKRAWNPVLTILIFPLTILLAIALGVMPILRLVINLIFFFAFCYLIPMLIVAGLSFLEIIELTNDTKTFILLVSTSAIALTFPTHILKSVYFVWGKVASRKGNVRLAAESTEYLLNPRNIRFSLFFVYLAFLIPYSYQFIQGNNLLESRGADLAVLQSFIVLIALNALITNSNGVSLYPSKLLDHVFKEYKMEWKETIGESEERK